MMIGIGTDMVDISRIERLLMRFGERFIQRCFTEGEQTLAAGRKGAGAQAVAATYAKRFAAKEACAKALGCGIGTQARLKEIETIKDPATGQPALKLHGKAAQTLQRRMVKGQKPVLHLSLADDYPLAQAFVVIEAVHRSSGT